MTPVCACLVYACLVYACLVYACLVYACLVYACLVPLLPSTTCWKSASTCISLGTCTQYQSHHLPHTPFLPRAPLLACRPVLLL